MNNPYGQFIAELMKIGISEADAQHLADLVAGDSLVNTANERGIFTDKLHKIKKAIQSTLTYTSI